MSASIGALLGFAGWTLVLSLVVLFYRSGLVFARKTAANSWTRGAQTWKDAPLITRLTHAQSNCAENLALAATVLLGAHALGQTAVTDGLAFWFLAARIAQSTVHMIAVNHWMVFIRANFFGVQLFILAYWLLKLAQLV